MGDSSTGNMEDTEAAEWAGKRNGDVEANPARATGLQHSASYAVGQHLDVKVDQQADVMVAES